MEKQPYVLIVDDDPDILEGITSVLEAMPYRLATAHDGKQCLQLIEQEVPDLLILDLLMPRMDGWAVIRALREGRNPRFNKLPIMILTTVLEDASRRRYELEVGMMMDVQDYVQKPVVPAEFLRHVGKLLKT